MYNTVASATRRSTYFPWQVAHEGKFIRDRPPQLESVYISTYVCSDGEFTLQKAVYKKETIHDSNKMHFNKAFHTILKTAFEQFCTKVAYYADSI